MPNPAQAKDMLNKTPDDKIQDDQLDKQIERVKKMAEIQSILPPPPKTPSITDMLGGPSTMAMLAPILSGVSKMISTMPNKNKLEGNIAGGNFSIEIVDEQTRDIALSVLNNLTFDKPQTTKRKKETK